MPSSKEKNSIQRARVSDLVGAGGEPLGEPPAPPPGILERLPDEMREKLPDELVDDLLAGARTEEEIFGSGGLFGQLTKRLVERAMEVELTDYLGYEPHQEPPGGTGNTRNGGTPKTLLTEHGAVPINTPRDRDGSFQPQIVKKRQRRFEGFDEKILALYSRGLSTRDIEAHLEEIYGVKVGRDLISKVTDAVMEDARAWQTRPLEDVYPVVFLDALVLKIRDGGSVQRRACYLALAIGMDGEREVLGMWFGANEGAKFWMQVLTDLKQRGVQDILICCVDGLKGFPEAIEAIFPATTVQTCIVHLIRHSLKYVPRRQYDAVVKDLKPIYTANNPDTALQALEAFEEKWGEQLPFRGKPLAALPGAPTAEAIVPAVEPDDRYPGRRPQGTTGVAASRCRRSDRQLRLPLDDQRSRERARHGVGGSRLLQQRNIAAARGRFSGDAATSG